MKKFLEVITIIMVLGALTACLIPANAQTSMEWQSATLQGSGSAYAPQITPVGATSAVSEATTTQSYSPAQAPAGPRRGFDVGGETGRSDESPIGDAVLPLMMMAVLFSSVVYIRRRKAVKE